jgi:hypothetical protein
MSARERAEFTKRLVEFQGAAIALSRAWEWMPGDAIEHYPEFLPSFDEAALRFASMRVRPEEPVAVERELMLPFGMKRRVEEALRGEADAWIVLEEVRDALWTPPIGAVIRDEGS